MNVEIKMPRLGLTMKEGTVQEWYKSEGDYIEKGEALCLIANEKMTSELESPVEGVLIMKVPEDQTISIQTKIAEITQKTGSDKQQEIKNSKVKEMSNFSEEVLTQNAKEADFTETIVNGKPFVEVEEEALLEPEVAEVKADLQNPIEDEVIEERNNKRILATPLARRMAKKFGIDLATIEGTGGGGRIIKSDVKEARRKINAGETLELQETEVEVNNSEPEVIQHEKDYVIEPTYEEDIALSNLSEQGNKVNLDSQDNGQNPFEIQEQVPLEIVDEAHVEEEISSPEVNETEQVEEEESIPLEIVDEAYVEEEVSSPEVNETQLVEEAPPIPLEIVDEAHVEEEISSSEANKTELVEEEPPIPLEIIDEAHVEEEISNPEVNETELVEEEPPIPLEIVDEAYVEEETSSPEVNETELVEEEESIPLEIVDEAHVEEEISSPEVNEAELVEEEESIPLEIVDEAYVEEEISNPEVNETELVEEEPPIAVETLNESTIQKLSQENLEQLLNGNSQSDMSYTNENNNEKVEMSMQDYKEAKKSNEVNNNRVMKKLYKQPGVKQLNKQFNKQTISASELNNPVQMFEREVIEQPTVEPSPIGSNQSIERDETIKDTIFLNKIIQISELESYQKQLHQQLQMANKAIDLPIKGFITRAVVNAVKKYNESSGVILYDGHREKYITLEEASSIITLSEKLNEATEITSGNLNSDVLITATFEEIFQGAISSNEVSYKFQLGYKISNDANGQTLLTLLLAVNPNNITLEESRRVISEIALSLENPMLLFL